MSEVIQFAIIIIAVVAVAGLVGYKIYLNWKKNGGGDTKSAAGVLTLISFVFKNLEYFSEEIQKVMRDVGDIDRDKYNSDDEYRRALIEQVVTIIETKAAEVNIRFSLNHNTLVDIADKVIDIVFDNLEKKKATEALPEATEKAAVPDKKTDISSELTDFYKD